MNKTVRIVVGVAGGMSLLVLILGFFFLGGGYYFDIIKRLIYPIQKPFIEYDCIKTGGEVVSANEIALAIVHHPGKACAYPYPDAGKECYDNHDCQGACILPNSFGEKVNIDNATLGKCQKYKNATLNCSTERKNRKIVTHMCVTE